MLDLPANNEVAFERWAGEILGRLSPATLTGLKRTLATAIRADQMQRIKAQLNPDGSAFEPRKRREDKGQLRARKGKIKRGIMFRKLASARYLKYQNTPEGISVGFFGRIARIARVHQDGLKDEVSPGGPSHRYASRVLLGLTPSTRAIITRVLIEHISA